MVVSATRLEAARSRRHYVSPHGAHSDVDTYMGMNKALLGDAQVEVRAVMVHFAAAHSSYGPVVAGPLLAGPSGARLLLAQFGG